MKSWRAALAAAFLITVLPGAVHAQAQPRAEAHSLDESLAFMGQLGEVVNVQVAGMKKLLDAKPLLDRMTSQAAVTAGAPKVRAMMAEARRSVEQANAMLDSIVPPPGLRYGSLTPQSMIADVKGQNAKLVTLFADYDAFLIAVERGDRAAAMKAAPRLMEASFLLVDGNAGMYRNRQAVIPATHSVHQALEIGVQMYRAMGVSGRGWVAARFGNRPDAAAASIRASLESVAREARAASSTGRANLARELAEFERRTSGLRFTGEEAATLERIRRALVGKEKLFAVGDSLAGLAEAAAKVSGAGLAAQPSPQLLGELAVLELRFQGALAEQAAIATGKAQ